MNDKTELYTTQYRNVFQTPKTENQLKLQINTMIVDGKFIDNQSGKTIKIPRLNSNFILNEPLEAINTQPNFSKAKKLTLADQIGQAVVREKNEDDYRKMLLENQSRDIEMFINNQYGDYHHQKDLTDNNNDTMALKEVEIKIENNVSNLQKNKRGRPKGSLNKKTIEKKIDIEYGTPSTSIMDPFDKTLDEEMIKNQYRYNFE